MLLLAELTAQSALAGSTIVVDSDEDSASPTAGDDKCTLCEALANANNGGNGDTISGDCAAGTGDPVSADVTFSPFLTAAPVTCAYIYQTPLTLKEPKAGHAITRANPKFSWKSLGKTETQYRIQIVAADQPDFSIPLRDVVTPAKKVAYPFDLPLAYGAYYWRVRGTSSVLTPFSTPRLFFMTAMKAPANGKILKHTTRPKFSWKKVPGAATYTLSVWASPDCSGSTFRNYPGLTKTSFPVPKTEPMPFSPYSWRITASTGQSMPCWGFSLTP